jgi:Predicted glycosyltransferases
MAQTYKDFILVILNNGGESTVVDELAENFAGVIKVVHSKDTISRAKALNKAIKVVADTKYIAILDDDDTWHPEFLERMIGHLKTKKMSGVVARADQVFEKISGDKIVETKRDRWMADMKVISLYQQCIDNQLGSGEFVYTRESYEALGGYDENLNVLEDFEFGIRFLQKYDVDFLDPGFALANYHRRVTKRGEKSDASFADDDHRYNFYKIANRYLRQELAEGRIGVGYIMSKLKYDQSYMAQVARRLMPKPVANVLKRRVQD